MAAHDSIDVTADREHRRMLLLAEFGRESLQHAELPPLLHRACESLLAAMDVERSKVLRYRPETADLLVIAGVGWHEGVVGHAILRTDIASPPGRALQTATSVAVEDLAASEEYRYSKLLREHGVRALINVPIIVDGLNWGVLEVDSTAKRRFRPADESFMQVLAHLVGAAILRAQAVDQEQRRAEAAAALATRRDLLTRELHHRVRNNFQIIVSMLLAQSRETAEPGARRAFRVAADRTIAIALAHEQLSIAQEMHTVNMARYLAARVGRVVPENSEISVDLDLRDVEVAVDQAVLGGLIVNEAITNALKHAFPGSGPGMIRVECAPISGRNLACVSISDNGTGMAQPRAGHSGLALVRALCSQLGSTLEIKSPQGGGTTIVLRFPMSR